MIHIGDVLFFLFISFYNHLVTITSTFKNTSRLYEVLINVHPNLKFVQKIFKKISDEKYWLDEKCWQLREIAWHDANTS